MAHWSPPTATPLTRGNCPAEMHSNAGDGTFFLSKVTRAKPWPERVVYWTAVSDDWPCCTLGRRTSRPRREKTEKLDFFRFRRHTALRSPPPRQPGPDTGILRIAPTVIIETRARRCRGRPSCARDVLETRGLRGGDQSSAPFHRRPRPGHCARTQRLL